MKNKKDISFVIETFDGCVRMTFLTRAKSHRKALRNLQKNSSDYRHIVKDGRDLMIKVMKYKPKKYLKHWNLSASK